MEDVQHLNYLAIFVSAIIYTALAAIWYSPMVFGKDWMECCKIGHDDFKKCCNSGYAWGFLNALVISLALSWFIHKAGAQTLSEGAIVAFWAWLGFVATTTISGVIWEKRTLHWWLINAGFSLVGLLVIGALLALWH